MINQELDKQLNMSYEDQLKYLKEKYGYAKENYFLDVNCTRKSNKNGRGKEGLFLHHDKEYDPDNSLVNNLCLPEMARQFDYDYQKVENLTYCNYLEHLMLHIKINLLRHEQLGSFISDGVINFMVPQLNDWYSYTTKLLPWQEIAFKLIEYDYDDYCEMLKYWLNHLDLDEESKNKFFNRLLELSGMRH